jgi:hypothetical protein
VETIFGYHLMDGAAALPTNTSAFSISAVKRSDAFSITNILYASAGALFLIAFMYTAVKHRHALKEHMLHLYKWTALVVGPVLEVADYVGDVCLLVEVCRAGRGTEALLPCFFVFFGTGTVVSSAVLVWRLRSLLEHVRDRRSRACIQLDAATSAQNVYQNHMLEIRTNVRQAYSALAVALFEDFPYLVLNLLYIYRMSASAEISVYAQLIAPTKSTAMLSFKLAQVARLQSVWTNGEALATQRAAVNDRICGLRLLGSWTEQAVHNWIVGIPEVAELGLYGAINGERLAQFSETDRKEPFDRLTDLDAALVCLHRDALLITLVKRFRAQQSQAYELDTQLVQMVLDRKPTQAIDRLHARVQQLFAPRKQPLPASPRRHGSEDGVEMPRMARMVKSSLPLAGPPGVMRAVC